MASRSGPSSVSSGFHNGFPTNFREISALLRRYLCIISYFDHFWYYYDVSYLNLGCTLSISSMCVFWILSVALQKNKYRTIKILFISLFFIDNDKRGLAKNWYLSGYGVITACFLKIVKNSMIELHTLFQRISIRDSCQKTNADLEK